MSEQIISSVIQETEPILFSNGLITVTRSRVQAGEITYAVRNITSVRSRYETSGCLWGLFAMWAALVPFALIDVFPRWLWIDYDWLPPLIIQWPVLVGAMAVGFFVAVRPINPKYYLEVSIASDNAHTWRPHLYSSKSELEIVTIVKAIQAAMASR